MTISIVIPSYNGRELLEANLPSVMDACAYWNYQENNWEVIVVNDGSNDDTIEWLSQNYPNIKVVTNQKNLRFARAVNKGVDEAKGDIIILLNNDVRPEKDFLIPLLKHFADKDLFAVGCLEKNIEAGETVMGGRGLGKFSRGFLVHHRALDQNKPDTLWVTAGSAAFRKTIWDKLGGFDPLFRPAYEEDRDLSYNAIKSGYKIAFEPKSKVEHIHETSNLKSFGKNKITIMSFKNQLLFVWKNISSPQLLFLHTMWLPYHLVMTTIRSRGSFLIGFFQAISQLPEALISRSRSSKLWKITDKQILDSKI